MTLVAAGRVGRPHGRDGSFWVDGAGHPLREGEELSVAGERRRVARRAGSDERPLIRLEGIEAREGAAALRGESLLVEAELASDEWLAEELVGCRVGGLGVVRRTLAGPSCDLLELEDGTLVPFVSDAVTSVDTGARLIEVDLEFLAPAPESGRGE